MVMDDIGAKGHFNLVYNQVGAKFINVTILITTLNTPHWEADGAARFKLEESLVFPIFQLVDCFYVAFMRNF